MELNLKDKHVLITGGSKGIGYACAAAFLAEGARVSLVSRSLEHLEAARQRLGAAVAGSHGPHPPARRRSARPARGQRGPGLCRSHLGPWMCWSTRPGAARRTPPEELNAQAWHDAMNAKFFTYVHMLDLYQEDGARGQGAIVNVVGAGGKVASPIHMPGGAANAALMLVWAWRRLTAPWACA